VKTGIIVFAHGSRIAAANASVCAVAEALARRPGFPPVEAAFLELASPSLPEAADRLVERGVERLIIVPFFLTPGLHMERDLPQLVEQISNKHRDLQVSVTASLDGHPGLVEIVAERALNIE
jgi:sirohydrochlorin ferrochelatase